MKNIASKIFFTVGTLCALTGAVVLPYSSYSEIQRKKSTLNGLELKEEIERVEIINPELNKTHYIIRLKDLPYFQGYHPSQYLIDSSTSLTHERDSLEALPEYSKEKDIYNKLSKGLGLSEWNVMGPYLLGCLSILSLFVSRGMKNRKK